MGADTKFSSDWPRLLPADQNEHRKLGRQKPVIISGEVFCCCSLRRGCGAASKSEERRDRGRALSGPGLSRQSMTTKPGGLVFMILVRCIFKTLASWFHAWCRHSLRDHRAPDRNHGGADVRRFATRGERQGGGSGRRGRWEMARGEWHAGPWMVRRRLSPRRNRQEARWPPGKGGDGGCSRFPIRFFCMQDKPWPKNTTAGSAKLHLEARLFEAAQLAPGET